MRGPRLTAPRMPPPLDLATPAPNEAASFPRTPGPPNPIAATAAAAMPLVQAYAPAVAPDIRPSPQLPPSGIGANVEARTVPFPIVKSGPEASVYSTRRPWTACDVYVEIVPDAAGLTAGVLTIFIYSKSNRGRTLVATGRYATFGLTPTTFYTKWAAGVRGASETWEVTAVWTQATAALQPPTTTANITVVGSDRVADLPFELGTEPANHLYLNGTLSSIGIGIAGVQIPPRLELVALRAANGVAAARFLQLHDLAADAGAGAVPIMVWPLGATIGAGLQETNVSYRAGIGKKLQLIPSSTMNTLTAVADCSVSALFR